MGKTNCFHRKRRFSNSHENSFIFPIDAMTSNFGITFIFNEESTSEIHFIVGSACNFETMHENNSTSSRSTRQRFGKRLLPLSPILDIGLHVDLEKEKGPSELSTPGGFVRITF